MKELIEYLEKQIELTVFSLELSDKDRYKLIGQCEMLEWIKVIEEKGFPDDNRNTK